MEDVGIVNDKNIERVETLCNEVVCHMGESESRELIKPLFRILENNPNFDFGMPGKIVHTLELFDISVLKDELLNSISRNPTFYTIWMINRVLNTLNDDRDPYIKALENIVKTSKEQGIVNQAQHFLDIQE